MADDVARPPRGEPSTTGRAPTGGRTALRRSQGVVNRVARVLLSVPVLSRVVGRGLIVLYVVGRKSGKRYTVPMAYLRHEGALLLGSEFAWGRNLRTGDALEVRFQGRRRTADVRVLTDEASVVEHYAVIARRNPAFARLNGIGVGQDGVPDPADLRAAWSRGARVFLLTLR